MENNLNKFLKELSKKKIDFYVISSSDENLNEYVPEENKRLQWLTNFSGSNGIALISKKEKYFFTDGRYLLQAKKEIEEDFQIIDLSDEDFFSFLKKKISNKKLLIDFRLFKVNFIKSLIKISQSSSLKIKHDKDNLIDKIWENRPLEKTREIFFINNEISGENTFSKKRKIFENSKYDFLILTSSASICWLMNIRGYDLEHTPLVFCKAIITKSDTKLFIDKSKIPNKTKIRKGLNILDIRNFDKEITKLPKRSNILLDSEVSYFYYELMIKSGLKPNLQNDPCELIKCQKNDTEIKNARKFHIWDGVSLAKFFYWLEKQNFSSDLNEINVSKKLEEIRKKNKNFFSSSFDTISACGKNGSIIHYNPKQNNKKLESGELYLCDSGAQYIGATTDCTRTICLGNQKPKREFVSNYTRVLQGHINLAMIKFPYGTKGHQIDSIARYFLWQNGMDYSHGTGHGVGSFLGVHEGPQSISKRINKFVLKKGMIVSNEPGYYKDNKYGIRIENLLLVKSSKYKGFLEFDDLTLFPYERNLIDIEMLSNRQIIWINEYHEKVYNKLGKYLSEETKSWLYKKTRKI